MRYPLIVFAFVFLAVLLVDVIVRLVRAQQPHTMAHISGGPRAGGGPAERLRESVLDTLAVFALLAGAALMSISLGKPGWWEQLVTQLVVLLQVIKLGLDQLRGQVPAQIVRLLVIAALLYVWIVQLPVFDAFPR